MYSFYASLYFRWDAQENTRTDVWLLYTLCFILTSGISEVCSSEKNSPTGDEIGSVKRVNNQASLLYRIRQTVTRDIHFLFSVCATCWFFMNPGKGFSYSVHSLRRLPSPACSFFGTQTARFLEFPIPLSYCFDRRWFCMILGSKTSLHCYNWLGFSELQDTKRFLFAWKRHISTVLPHSGETVN
jgi:hypothetical protein